MAPTHYGRYRFAAGFVHGGRVVDVACGEGYGSDLLSAAGAAQVVGVDRDEAAIRAAVARYRRPGLAFRVADAAATGEADGSADLVVSFETIEHVADAAAFVTEIARILRPGGLCVVSTPNRLVTGQHNPYHTREFALGELTAMLNPAFEIVGLYSQMPVTLGVRALRALYGVLVRIGLDRPVREVFALASGATLRQRPVLPTPLKASYREDGPDQPVYLVVVARRRGSTAAPPRTP